VDAGVIEESPDPIPRIPQMVAQHLKTRLEGVEVRKVPLHRFLERHRRTWAVNAPTGPGSAFFVLLVKRQKRDKDEWMILVAPPLYLKRPRDAFVELPRLCGEIHEFLTTTPGISKIRWYFQGFGAYFGVAPTPDELPWGRA
jgi:hypothetical protein